MPAPIRIPPPTAAIGTDALCIGIGIELPADMDMPGIDIDAADEPGAATPCA